MSPLHESEDSVCGLMWRALEAEHHFGKSVKPRPYMCLHDSTHLTTHGQQLRAYRTYEELLLRLPHQLQEPDTLLGIADTLLHLPETFPAAYLKVYDPIITQCLRLSGALQHIDLADILSFQIPQLDKTRLSDSLVGYGFPVHRRSLLCCRRCARVKNASFPAMLCYSDPDYWLEALSLAFHQKGPLKRAAGLPVVLGFPETDNRITDLQVNVPPAAMVAFLTGRAYVPCSQICGGPPRTPPSPWANTALQAWAEAARHTDLETARLAQQPSVNAFVRISLQGSQTLGHRQYQEFRPGTPPVHFLDAIRQVLAASVANQDIEHFWSVYNLEWDTTARVLVFLQRVLPFGEPPWDAGRLGAHCGHNTGPVGGVLHLFRH